MSIGKHSPEARSPAPAEFDTPIALLGQASPPHSSPPSSVSAALCQPSRRPTRMTRRLRCGTAPGNAGTRVYRASSTRHETPKRPGAFVTIPAFPHPPPGTLTSHPTSSERNAAKSRPPLMASTAGTFSQTTHLASVFSASRANSMARPPLGSAIPPRLPPVEKDWQGVPPTRRSMSPSQPPFPIFVKSPRFGTSGNLCLSTSDANGSISETNAQRQPRGRHATVAASIPLHTLPYRMAEPPFRRGCPRSKTIFALNVYLFR